MADRKRAGLREITLPRPPAPSNEELLAWMAEPVTDAAGPSRALDIEGANERLRLFALRIYLDHGLPIHDGPMLEAPRYRIEAGRAVVAQKDDPLSLSQCALGERIIGPDTEAALAGRILSELRMMEIAARDNNTDLMRRAAMAAGALGEVFSIEFEYGPMLSNLSALEQGRATRARNAKAAGDLERARVQGWANEVWADKPALSAKSVAMIVAKRHGGNPDTIRRQIKKPVTLK